MSVRYFLGYWTIFVNDKPVMTCVSMASAVSACTP